MAFFRFKKGFQRPQQPQITFMTVHQVMTTARLLAEKRGSQNNMDRLDCLIYACLIYDNYAQQYKVSGGAAAQNWSQRRTWTELSQLPPIPQFYLDLRPVTYHSRVIGEYELTLPIHSNDPFRPYAHAPQGFAPNTYKVSALGHTEFIEVAYQVRCNLLHGSYDIAEDDTARTLLSVGAPFSALVWKIVSTTSW